MEKAKVQNMQYLWNEFYQLACKLTSSKGCYNATEVHEYKERVNNWFTKFCEMYQKRHVTPYIHVLVTHVPELLGRFGSIAQFSQQGLEKLNDMTTKSYFRSTNHRKVYALSQLMDKQNRVEHLENLNTPDLMNHGAVCSTCKQRGHNVRTCTQKISEK